MKGLETLTQAYIEALFFSASEEDLQGADMSELAPATLERINKDCAAFWDKAQSYLNFDMVMGRGGLACAAGHDFALTRNRHGAGFWDGDWDTPREKAIKAKRPSFKTRGEALTDIAHAFGEFEIYRGDDGKIYA